MTQAIIELKQINKYFKNAEGQDLLVLKEVDFQLQEGEIVALLGKSGSGKSTLMRIIAGLLKPSNGEAHYFGKMITDPVNGISMVFQNFALLPWLTVLQNVELGLEAQGIAAKERRKRALEAIDMIGLDGFESAYPKELSGGMKQRVGFARALVVDPEVLVMDEPFSALDVLTAENLRSDLLALWHEGKTRLKGLIIVTHSIAEAVEMADRVIIFDADPGCVKSELKIELAYPRDEDSPAFSQLVDQVYSLMTARAEDKLPFLARLAQLKSIGIHYRLPDVNASEISGLLENLGECEGSIDLPELAEDSHLDVDDLFPLIEALEIMHFAQVSKGDIRLTQAGKQYAKADILERKQIFAHHLKDYIPLAEHICRVLHEKRNHRASEERFLSKLEDHFSEKEAERILTTLIDWARYAELFAYDFNSSTLSLEDPE